ncbi:MAG: hypothetical protein B7Y39_10835 [Bdellovibrio sp. 28-41-41]|nr:MAG: hypothetical protein B7Y39_10835 [Bdellovibrio sp. 28-41-41]
MFKIVASLVLFALSVSAAPKISAYQTAPFQTKEVVIQKLKDSGFEFLADYAVNKNSSYTTILFTSTLLKEKAKKTNRGFAALSRILINSEKKELRIANPNYFLRAFLQDDFDSEAAQSTYEKLKTAFGPLNDTDDLLKEKDLKKYRFMFGMPYYEDLIEVGTGQPNELVKKLKDSNSLIFDLEMDSNKRLCAVMLPEKIESFPETLKVSDNALLLPYLVLLEDEKAKILHAKYYLAVSLPQLGMGQFMTISDVPGKIEDTFKELLK